MNTITLLFLSLFFFLYLSGHSLVSSNWQLPHPFSCLCLLQIASLSLPSWPNQKPNLLSLFLSSTANPHFKFFKALYSQKKRVFHVGMDSLQTTAAPVDDDGVWGLFWQLHREDACRQQLGVCKGWLGAWGRRKKGRSLREKSLDKRWRAGMQSGRSTCMKGAWIGMVWRNAVYTAWWCVWCIGV